MTRRRERTARSQSALSVTRPCDSSRRRMSAASGGGVKPQAASLAPAAAAAADTRRRRCPALRCAVVGGAGAEQGSGRHGCAGAPEARRYSTASVLLGFSSRAASASPSRAAAARWRRTAKGRAAVSRTSGGRQRQGLSRPPPAAAGQNSSPHSLPNSSVSAPASASAARRPARMSPPGTWPRPWAAPPPDRRRSGRPSPPAPACPARQSCPLGEIAAHSADHRVRTHGAGVGRSRAWPLWRGQIADNTDVHGRLLSFFLFYRGTGQNAT